MIKLQANNFVILKVTAIIYNNLHSQSNFFKDPVKYLYDEKNYSLFASLAI